MIDVEPRCHKPAQPNRRVDKKRGQHMIMRVGPYLYRVERVAGYIRHEGNCCLGLCDNDEHVLYVADVGTEAQQFQVTCHEYMEAWLYHFGPETGQGDGSFDKEKLCDVCGLAMTQFALDFMQQANQHTPQARPAPPQATPPDTRHVHDDGRVASRRWVVDVHEPINLD